MISRVIAVLCAMGLGLPAFCQTPAIQAEPPDNRYVGVVTGTSVYVRSNASMTAYPCTKLDAPARVTVVGKVPDWLKILPPEGVFSVIARQYVRPDSEGNTGTVTGDRVWVRAGGTLRLTGFWALQKQLNRGQKVRILGTVEDYYKIEPPDGVYFWISDRYVKPLSSMDEARTQPTTHQAVSRPVVRPAATAPVARTRPAEDAVAAAVAAFRALEDKMRAEYDKPPEQRDLEGLLEDFQALKAPPDAKLQPYVDYWVSYLKRSIARRNQSRQFQEIVTSAAKGQQSLETKRTALEARPLTPRKTTYAARGILSASAIYTGGPTGPKRFFVRDPKTGAITAYVQSTGDRVPLVANVGKNVGIIGTGKYNKEMWTTVIEATEIHVLDDKPSVTGPPEPRVQPLPPAPKPLPKPKVQPKPEPKLKVQPKPEPKPKVQPKPEPKPKVQPRPIAEPKPAPKPKVQPKPEPKPKVQPKPKPKPKTQPTTQPTTKPASAKPLPPTGLPIVEPTSQPEEPIVEEEYD